MATQPVTILYFGVLKDVAGREREEFTVPSDATVGALLAAVAASNPKLQKHLPSIAVSINQEFASRDATVRAGDEIGLLPPVSGGKDMSSAHPSKDGQGGAPRCEPFVRIVHERIVPHDIVPPRERPEDGAIVIFDGVVRNHSRNRRTLYLVYEAYEEMALKQLRVLAAEALQRFGIRDVAIVHRVGRIEIGESSVLIAVYSAHRAAAFDACRYVIDTLKKTVPIWKKEYFEDGAVWADGEPFPADIATSDPARSLSE